VGWATLLLQAPPEEANPEQAAALLALVQDHPAAEAETRSRASQLLARLSPAQRVDRSARTLAEVVAEVLEN
jgi:hypothetical protein